MAADEHTSSKITFREACCRRAWGPDFDKIYATVLQAWPRDVIIEAVPLARELMDGKVVAMLDGRPAAERFWAALYARLNGAEERARVVGEFVLILEIENATRGVTIILNQPAEASPEPALAEAATAPIVAAPGAEERLRSESLEEGDEETDEKKLAAMPIEKLPRGVRLFVGLLREDYKRRPKPDGKWMPVPTPLGELQNKHHNEIPKDPKKPNQQLRTLERALHWLAVNGKDWSTDRTRTVHQRLPIEPPEPPDANRLNRLTRTA
jgi:hypothetical protein